MLSKEVVQHVLTEIGRTQYAAIGERSLHKECKPDQMIQRTAELLQVGLYVHEYVAPLCGRVSGGTTSLFERIVIVNGCRIAGQKDKSFRSCDDCALAPWHQTAALPLLVITSSNFPSNGLRQAAASLPDAHRHRARSAWPGHAF